MDNWPELQSRMEQADLKRRVRLSTWFVDPVSRLPDVLEQLWSGSQDADAVGWRWCEYRLNDRKTYPAVFFAIYGDYLDQLPTVPLFILRAQCSHCGEYGFFVSINLSKADREAKGIPTGRCAVCRRMAAIESSRRWRAMRRFKK